MIFRGLILALVFALPSLATDWSSVPKLPHKVVADWPQLPAGWNFGMCSGVTVDSEGMVWVFNRGKHPVIAFDKSGGFLRAWAEVPVVAAHGIKADPFDDIWLTDVAGHAVMKFSPEGRLQMMLGQAGNQPAPDNDAPYAFNRPSGLVFRPDGGFYVSDGYVNTRIVEYTRQGEYVRHWGTKGTGDGEFDLVHDVALDDQGRVYVADRNNARVQVFDPKGKFLAKWTDVGVPWGLTYVAAQEAIYMADGDNNRIVKLNLDGKPLGQLSEFGKIPGKLDFAHHIAVDAEGSIYVAEIKNWRVQKFALP